MSDLQDPLIEQQIQQRQILAMMGIDQWVRSDSPTVAIADVMAAIKTPVIKPSLVISTTEYSNSFSSIAPNGVEDNLTLTDQETNVSTHDASEAQPVTQEGVNQHSDISISTINSTITTGLRAADEQSDKSLDTFADDNLQRVDQLIESAVAPKHESLVLNNEVATNHQPENSLTNLNKVDEIAPFDLQGGRYGNWVLLVDIQALNNDSQKLWQNIIQALSMTCESASFPICAGMDTVELANASFAGYIFKVGRSEVVQIAALTALPDGIEHPYLNSLPTLNEMIDDSMLKRQLWERISH